MTAPIDDIHLRRARADDLQAMLDIQFDNAILGEPDPPPRPGMFPDYAHLLATGELHVAEQNGRIVGYAGVVARGETAFLTDLFIAPDVQSRGVGGRLLRHALAPFSDRLRFTVSSTDPRALALYIRAGMQPHWPHLNLTARAAALGRLAVTDAVLVRAVADDPKLVAWDGKIGGRVRPQDHAYWVEREGGEPFWFERGGTIVGYGYVRLRRGTFRHPEAAIVGPIGVAAPVHGAACAIAALRWAAERAPMLRIDLPGPHPALPSLLDGGMQISYTETFVASSAHLPFDPTCYLGSGGTLF